MDWSLRRDIAKSGNQFILVNNIRGNFAANDFTENGFFGHDVFLFPARSQPAAIVNYVP
jgi:hypothetical protein